MNNQLLKGNHVNNIIFVLSSSYPIVMFLKYM